MTRERHAFVSGASGFVGVNLVGELLDRGWKVTALHRPTSSLTYLGRLDAERVVGDVTDLESLKRAVPQNVDAFFHVAAALDFWSRRNAQQTRVNVLGTQNAVTAALERGARRFVHTSSIAAWGLHDDVIDESTPQEGALSWVNYLRTKATAETIVRHGIARGLRAVIVNPANIVGPYDLKGWSTMIRVAARGRLPAVPSGGGSFCHVREVVRAQVAAAERGRVGENYLLGGADASYLEFARTIGEVTGAKVPKRATPYRVLWTIGKLLTAVAAVTGRRPLITPEIAALGSGNLRCTSAKAERELGYRPVPLRDMVEDAYRWLRDEGKVR